MLLRSGFTMQWMPLRVGDESATMTATVMEESSDEKKLRSVSFVVHATRGVLRDQSTRRKMMFVILIVALVLLFSGSTFLAPWLEPREHLIGALIFWFICVWLTLTALLLALLDLLLVRAAARKAERALHDEFSHAETPNSPGGRE